MDILQLHQAERALQSFPGRTVAELANDIGADREILRERLLDLEASGKAHQGPNAFCRVTGRSSPTWQAGRDPSTSEVPAELANEYANALDAMTPPVSPELFPAADAATHEA